MTSVDTASEALAVSLSERRRGQPICHGLRAKARRKLQKELAGVIFQNPVTEE